VACEPSAQAWLLTMRAGLEGPRRRTGIRPGIAARSIGPMSAGPTIGRTRS